MRLNELFSCQMNYFAMLIARFNSGKDSLHVAEKKALQLGQLYVQFKVQLMYCLILCCVLFFLVALLACIAHLFYRLPHQDLHSKINTGYIASVPTLVLAHAL
jgi:hypothetical protein